MTDDVQVFSTDDSSPALGQAARALALKVQSSLGQVVQGQAEGVQALLIGVITGGHVLLEGVPGVAKTLMVRSLAASLASRYSRIQFTPDLMPSDVMGVNIFEPHTGNFRFKPGPLFSDIVLADEINRAPAKTQSALLEAMQERQVSIDGTTHALSPLFTVVATQNPLEYEGTYPLPEAQLDRFLLKVVVDYPSEGDERSMLEVAHRQGARAGRPGELITPVAQPEELLAVRALVHQVGVSEAVRDYILRLVRGSRHHARIVLGASPRAAVMLMLASKALALLRGRDHVSPEEVQAILLPVLRHRIRLTPEAEIEGLSVDKVLQSLLEQVSIPR